LILFDKCAELLPRWAFDLQTDLVELILNIWTLQYNINLTLEPLNDRIGCVCWTEERKPRRSRGSARMVQSFIARVSPSSYAVVLFGLIVIGGVRLRLRTVAS
jgi:hypothetical protein